MKKILFIIFGGLLPLWVAITKVLIDGYKENYSETYWTTAPWLIIYSLKFCTWSLAITFASIAIFDIFRGNKPRKTTVATTVVIALLILLISALSF